MLTKIDEIPHVWPLGGKKKNEIKIMIFRNFFIVYIFTLKNQFVQKRRGSQSFGAKTGPGLKNMAQMESFKT